MDWKQRGPGNVGGRTRGFIVDPDDPTGNTWFAGPVGGGVWKTTNAGQNWENITLDLPNLSVSSLVMANSNHNIIYAGTGEGFGNLDAITGNGIFKSIDKGQTWVLLTNTSDDSRFKYVNRLVVNPKDENELLAATNAGIFKSMDGGESWAITLSEQGSRVQDLRYPSGNFNMQFATVNSKGIFASIDAGDTWKKVKEIGEGRIELCISETFPDRMFAMTSESNLYLSVDGGDNWAETTPDSKVAFLSGQGWYNNTMVAHPTNVDNLFVGGLDLYKVTINDETGAIIETVYDVVDGTSAWLTYNDLGGQYMAGGIHAHSSNSSLFKSVEVRFGNGRSQKAHRFTVGGSTNSQLVTSDYVYKDYVSVPFEVWDTESNTQLMVSFRDQDENGDFNLSSTSLEQYFIHAINYNSTSPSSDIGTDGGVDFQKILSVFPVMEDAHSWNPSGFPDMTLQLKKYELKSRALTSKQLTVWHADIDKPNYAHADHHNLTVVKNAGNPFRIINCNDGGIALSDDGGNNWTSPIKGYVTTQFYGVSKHPTKNIYVGGTQDNGTWVSGEDGNHLDVWTSIVGGDGFETVWHARDEKKFGGSLYYNEIVLTRDGVHLSKVSGIGDMGDEGEAAPFITRIANAPSSPDLLMVGGKSGAWRSEDFGLTWDLIKMPEASWASGNYNPLFAISPINSRYIWAGTYVGNGYRPALSTDGGKSFSTISTPLEKGAYLSRLVADPVNVNTAYALFAHFAKPKILKTNDFGETWAELSGFGSNARSNNGFPDVAVYSLVVMPHNQDVLWAGTEIGLFESTDGGLSWNFADNGLPAVCIWDMKIVGQQVVVGTHGLGVWTVDIPDIIVHTSQPIINVASKKPSGSYYFEFEFFQDYDRAELVINGQVEKLFENVIAGKMVYDLSKNIATEEISVQVICYIDEQQHTSNYKWFSNPTRAVPVEKYMNSFSDRQHDFTGDLSVSNELFSDYAIHSNHPYTKKSSYTYELNQPIVVLENREEALFSYRDIALVEPGSAGTKFGDFEYWDYVIVEGTKDGLNWLPLVDGSGVTGYDVNYSSKWVSFGQEDLSKVPNRASLFETHVLNLQDTFSPKDTILIRFRMYSDEESVGWGWVIDDIVIQEQGTGLFSPKSTPEGTLSIAPNPVVNDIIRVKLEAEAMGEAVVSIYNVNGMMELSRTYNKQTTLLEETIATGTVSKGLKIVSVAINGEVYSQKVMVK